MTIETRIKKLEKKIITPTKLKYHVVLVEHGASEKEAIQKFKDHNELLPSDKLIVVQFVKSKRQAKND